MAKAKAKVSEALEAVAKVHCPRGFNIDDGDRDKLLSSLKIENGIVSCPSDITIRLYNHIHIQHGAAIGAGSAGGAGFLGGVLIGAAAGTAVPGVGNVVGALVGGTIGLISGAVSGAAVGAGTGAGIGRAVSIDKPTIITSKEVFQELPGYKEVGTTVTFTLSN